MIYKRIYKFLEKNYEKVKIKFLLDFVLKYLRWIWFDKISQKLTYISRKQFPCP